jgi:hypothetical protein
MQAIENKIVNNEMLPSKQGFLDHIYGPAIKKIYGKIRLLVVFEDSLVGSSVNAQCLDRSEEEALSAENYDQINLRRTLAVLAELENLKVAIQWNESGFKVHYPVFIESRSPCVWSSNALPLNPSVLDVNFLSVWIGQCEKYMLDRSDIWTVYQLLLRMCDPGQEEYSSLCNDILQCADMELRHQRSGVDIKGIIFVLQKLVQFHVILGKMSPERDDSGVVFVKHLMSGYIYLFSSARKGQSSHHLSLKNMNRLVNDEQVKTYLQVESKRMQKTGASIPYMEPRMKLLESTVSSVADRSYRRRQISQTGVSVYLAYVRDVFTMIRGLLKLIPGQLFVDNSKRSQFMNCCELLLVRMLKRHVINGFDLEKIKDSLKCARDVSIQWESVIDFSDTKYRLLNIDDHRIGVVCFKHGQKTKLLSLIDSNDRVDFSSFIEFVQSKEVEKATLSDLTL